MDPPVVVPLNWPGPAYPRPPDPRGLPLESSRLPAADVGVRGSGPQTSRPRTSLFRRVGPRPSRSGGRERCFPALAGRGARPGDLVLTGRGSTPSSAVPVSTPVETVRRSASRPLPEPSEYGQRGNCSSALVTSPRAPPKPPPPDPPEQVGDLSPLAEEFANGAGGREDREKITRVVSAHVNVLARWSRSGGRASCSSTWSAPRSRSSTKLGPRAGLVDDRPGHDPGRLHHRLRRLPEERDPQLRHLPLLGACCCWNFFQTGVITATGVVVNNAGLVKKVSFPREILAGGHRLGRCVPVLPDPA